MGAWTVTIDGHGPHDNEKDYDIENLVVEFINKVRKDHTINRGSLTIGSRKILKWEANQDGTFTGGWNYE